MSAYSQRVPSHLSPLWRDRRPFLSSLDFELTERCNNNCIHCCINVPADDSEARRRELSQAEIEDLLRQAAALGCLDVCFTGGEPLLRPEFGALYEFARRLGLRVRIFTNARLVTPELADLFARIPPLVSIETTVYGMSAATYDAVSRIPGSYAQFRRGVDLLLDRRVPLLLKFAYLPANRGDLDAFDAWARSMSAQRGTPSVSMFFDLRHRRDSETRNEEIRAVRVSPEEGLAVLTRDPERYRKETADFCSRFMGPCGDRLFGCGAGQSGCVDAYGRYQPCLSLRAPEFNIDLRRVPLRDALTRTRERLAATTARNPEYLERCAMCPLHGLCNQCPALSWAESGTLDTPVEYLCEVAHSQAQHLGMRPINIQENAA